DRAPRDEEELRLGRDGAAGRCDALEQVVERADRAAEQTAATAQQVALDPVDVRPVRHDQERLVVQAGEIALEEQRDLARMRGPCDEAQPHRAMVVLSEDGIRPRTGAKACFERTSSRARPRRAPELDGGAFRPAAAARRCASGHLAGAVVAEIRDPRTAARVGNRDAHRGTLVLADFLVAVIADKNGSPGHVFSSLKGWLRSKGYPKNDVATARRNSGRSCPFRGRNHSCLRNIRFPEKRRMTRPSTKRTTMAIPA